MTILPKRYSAPSITLHWLIAVLIVATFALGWIMTDIPGFTPTKLKYFSWHKWLGVTVFAFAILRVLWRVTHAVPAMPSHMPAWQKAAAHCMHHLLYVFMFLIPLTGYFYSSSAGIQVVYLGLFPLPPLIDASPSLSHVLKPVHVYLNYTMAVLVILHALAAVKHQFIDKDGTLGKMLPFFKSPQ